MTDFSTFSPQLANEQENTDANLRMGLVGRAIGMLVSAII